MPQLPAVWRSALEAVRVRRTKLHYKPAALLVALDIIERADQATTAVTYADFNTRFAELFRSVDPSGADQAWQPFFHLSTGDQVWDLYHQGQKLTPTKPIEEASRKYVEEFANEARFKPQLTPFLGTAEGRAEIRRAIFVMLLADGDPLSSAIAALEERGLALADTRRIQHWWELRPDEIFWLEVTRRPDLGANLNAPQTNEDGKEYWSYSLIKAINEGDVVYHYDGNSEAIVARSIAMGVPWNDQVIWAARGSSARSANITPHPRPGWYRGLEGYERLPVAITLDAIREKDTEIRFLKRSLAAEAGEPLYFPFETGDKRPLRPLQGYLFKLPKDFLKLFISEPFSVAHHTIQSLSRNTLGDAYRPANELTAIAKRDPFAVDPTLVERGVRGHAVTQNLLAEHLRSVGIEPRSPTADEPDFDIAWSVKGRPFVAEVKSITIGNEEKQLRLGLGQVLRYSHQLGSAPAVVPVLVAERRPRDPTWDQLCERLGVILAWPDVFAERLTKAPLSE
jgi:hypothetical protein